MTSLIAEISEQVGLITILQKGTISPRLRRENRIRTIHSSLAIEHNSLSLEQVTAILNGRRVLGNPNEIKEILNAYEGSCSTRTFTSPRSRSFSAWLKKREYGSKSCRRAEAGESATRPPRRKIRSKTGSRRSRIWSSAAVKNAGCRCLDCRSNRDALSSDAPASRFTRSESKS